MEKKQRIIPWKERISRRVMAFFARSFFLKGERRYLGRDVIEFVEKGSNLDPNAMNESMPTEELYFSLVKQEEEYALAKELFREYAEELGIDLCFQNFERELREIQVQYGLPSGFLLFVQCGEEVVGCVGVRERKRGVAELKRMYIRPTYRGRGYGRKLLEEALRRARALSYRKIGLDSLPSMQAALALYQSLGFVERAPYYAHPVNGVHFFELDL